MTQQLLLYFATGAALAYSQTPSFTAPPGSLQPGMLVSIYGKDLGPQAACSGKQDAPGIYPSSICGTQVLVDGMPAGLLYVQSNQVNFQVPREMRLQGTADLAVVYQGRSSKAVSMPLGARAPEVELENPARVGMPVWLRVSIEDTDIPYPSMVFPAAFGCTEVEVRRDGMALPRIADIGSQAFGGIAFSGSPCGGIAYSSEPHFRGRLPLHLQYRFDRPGTYEVQLTRRNFPGGQRVVIPWTKLEILPDDGRRQQWLEDKAGNAPKDAADLLTDFLPSILGNPDDESLRILRPYLYHPDRVVREYAMYGLTYWPGSEVAPKLWEWMRAEGPSDVTVRYLMHVKPFAASHANELAELSIPYLQSDSPVLVYGALSALAAVVLPADSLVKPDIRARAGEAMIHAADHILPIDPENTNQFVSDLGQLRNERAHELLWDLVNRHGPGYEEAMIAITWQKSPADLPKLAQLALQPANGRSLGGELFGIPCAIHAAYGDAAIPYLDTLLQRSEFTSVRTSSARELILAKRPEGFAFVEDAIANGRSYRQEMIQSIRDQFPDLRQADEGAITKFVAARAAGN